MKKTLAGGCALLVAAGMAVTTAAPASAASCIVSAYRSYSSDYARTTDASGGCSVVRVGHYFSPAGISSTIYTGTFSSSGDAVQTGSAAELTSSNHSGS
ncbi:hypothetical protein FBY24_1584 [Cellulomonas sp. SLBN-39]|nr:hypothetical protein FBY24_1584 [Cellulomonas sp. SLBN-39]